MERKLIDFRKEDIMIKFYGYSKCSTVKKAKKWLQDNNIEFAEIDLINDTPTKDELEQIYKKSGMPIKKFFNTSGIKYRELGLKDIVKTETDDKLLEILASDGMLIKRPMIVGEDIVINGFKEKEYEEKLLNNK